ncbi:acylneuraminate cytidylyltransferase family protein [Psychroflexus sp. YR1-1]|uniref:Acylneuraminate cytidylyltransferase family protein n=1 Tax=Psychroflexus aurantiacus TaxID=2709310 RepID=A0A6B3R5Q7_9FLAO|nr:acylneuraminate cytidylyltransferase family protein [Psychroflexus aurantiacus]NEV92734.1 acylneuraminate cytidylyltransferase family protein [Psychroflexus aurantiacus]
MNQLVVIPARGGSKGVPRKNIKLLGGKPLIHWTIEVAREIFPDEVICVSTDDEEIQSVVEQTGLKIPFLRPEELATDIASSYEVLLHAVFFYEKRGYYPDTLILLQPTSPFRSAKQIKEAIDLYVRGVEMIVSVKETKANPYYVLREEDENGFLVKSKESDAIRRQDVPKVWELNGAIYVINIKALKSKSISDFTKVKKYVMDEVSSHDIDTMLDWKIAKTIQQSINGV